MHIFKRVVKENKHNELITDFKSIYSDPVLTTGLHKYQLGYTKKFTRNKLWDVKKEIENVTALNVIQRIEQSNTMYLKINMMILEE